MTSSYAFAISFAVQFARCKWNREPTRDAVRSAMATGILAGGTSLITGVIAAQVLRTKIAALSRVTAQKGVRAIASSTAGRKAVQCIAHASLGKAVYGPAALNHIAKLLRSNFVTASVIVAVSTTPDFYRAGVARNISWQQFSKNFAVTAIGVGTGVAGWMAGAGAGVALGTVVPVVGNITGGIVGGLLGGLAGGWLGTVGAKAGMHQLLDDDAKKMIRLLEGEIGELATDYLLSENEINELMDKVKETVTDAWLRSMYQAGVGTDPDTDRRAFAYNAFDGACLEITRKRETIILPVPGEVRSIIDEVSEEISNTKSRPNHYLHPTASSSIPQRVWAATASHGILHAIRSGEMP